MKYAFAIYWLIGCAAIGLVTGSSMTRCPLDERPVVIGDAVAVAIWPAFAFAAMTAHDVKIPACKVNP